MGACGIRFVSTMLGNFAIHKKTNIRLKHQTANVSININIVSISRRNPNNLHRFPGNCTSPTPCLRLNALDPFLRSDRAQWLRGQMTRISMAWSWRSILSVSQQPIAPIVVGWFLFLCVCCCCLLVGSILLLIPSALDVMALSLLSHPIVPPMAFAAHFHTHGTCNRAHKYTRQNCSILAFSNNGTASNAACMRIMMWHTHIHKHRQNRPTFRLHFDYGQLLCSWRWWFRGATTTEPIEN